MRGRQLPPKDPSPVERLVEPLVLNNIPFYTKTDKNISALKNSKEARDAEDSRGAEEDVGELKGVMTSPNFGLSSWGHPLRYPPNVHETKTIVVPQGKKIRIQFTHFRVENCENCDYVRITEGDGTILGKYKHKPSEESIVSKTNTVHVLFHTDSSVETDGWRLEWGESKIPLLVDNLCFRGKLIASPHLFQSFSTDLLRMSCVSEAVEDATLSSDNCASPWTQLSTGCYL